mgnify:CR=1 FL=1
MEILAFSLYFLKMLTFCYKVTSGTNIFTNIEAEKTKREREADAFISR